MAGRRGGGGQISFLAAVERPLLLRCSTGSGDQTWRFRSRKLGDDFQRRMIESEQQNQIVVELIANLTADQLDPGAQGLLQKLPEQVLWEIDSGQLTLLSTQQGTRVAHSVVSLVLALFRRPGEVLPGGAGSGRFCSYSRGTRGRTVRS